mmetsp:Transcript_49553/g.55340  ORF Transcript_49553/g.55340 Transcript_49553/m.55340 type:complete len:461 (+) Transcript_49553:12-1394(+)
MTTTIDGNRKWCPNLALFGDSNFALFSSSTLLVFSFLISLFIDGNLQNPLVRWWNISPTEIAYRQLGPTPNIAPAKIFQIDYQNDELVSPEMQEAFDRDGVIAIRGLLDLDLLKLLDDTTTNMILKKKENIKTKEKKKPRVLTGRKKNPTQFFTVNQGAIFSSLIDKNSTVSTSDVSPFVKVAMMSSIPRVVANLLHFDDCDTCANKTLRILRDIFLAKDGEEYVCGYHVDDLGFWPALAEKPAGDIGINAWVALDDMPIKNGGGFALAVGSHSASWKEEAYNLTGSTHSFPDGGFQSARDVLDNRPGNGTCNIQYTAPHLHRRMEETKRVYDIRYGDVIFHTRWLFHRTVPFHRDVVSQRFTDKEDPLLYRRYSIRYGPGATSIIPNGWSTEPSVISEEKNGGRTADDVSQYDAAWYPRVWPSISELELEQMKILAKERLPTALVTSEQRKRVTRPRLK